MYAMRYFLAIPRRTATAPFRGLIWALLVVQICSESTSARDESPSTTKIDESAGQTNTRPRASNRGRLPALGMRTRKWTSDSSAEKLFSTLAVPSSPVINFVCKPVLGSTKKTSRPSTFVRRPSESTACTCTRSCACPSGRITSSSAANSSAVGSGRGQNHQTRNPMSAKGTAQNRIVTSNGRRRRRLLPACASSCIGSGLFEDGSSIVAYRLLLVLIRRSGRGNCRLRAQLCGGNVEPVFGCRDVREQIATCVGQHDLRQSGKFAGPLNPAGDEKPASLRPQAGQRLHHARFAALIVMWIDD